MKPIFLAVILLAQSAHSATAIQPVILTEQGAKNLGIETVVVEESDFEKTTFALGRTEAIPESRAALSSRIPGRVIESRLKFGARVEKGEKLVLLESRQSGDPPPSIWLTAPASGTIISMNTVLGSPVEPSETLAEIADLSTIYLIATLPQSTAGKIQTSAQARIRFPIFPEKEYTATLLKHVACPHSYPTHTLNREQESESPNLNNAGVIFTIENPDNHLRPGMNAECSIIMEKREAILSVPREAIQGSPSNRHVYVRHMTIPHAFDRVNVQTGMTSGDRIEILDGLFPGDEVVTRGSYSLGFAGGGSGVSLKEALDAAHGHEHNEDGSEKSPGQKAETETDVHDHAEPSSNNREILFMISTGILAVLLLIVSLRRKLPSDENAELS
ncbi:MAG: hypothetical protein RLZZ505_3280 [Verrucomicrobiota bacterium]|jgi:multidrug efflux pump subunit AcrA (membrane-fusion protein)